MRNFSELLDLYYNPVIVFVMAIFAYIFMTLMNSVYLMLFSKMFKVKVVEIKALGFKWEHQHNGKWIYTGYKPGLGFAASSHYDLDKCEGMTFAQMKANENLYLVCVMIANLLTATGIFIAGLAGGVNIPSELLASITVELGTSVMVFTLIMAVITIRVLIRVNNKNSLIGYQQSVVAMVRANIPFEKLDLKSVPELHFKKVTDYEKEIYFPFYFAYLDATEQFDKMAAAVGDIEQTLKPNGDSRVDRFIYCTLTYYFSTIYFDPEKAKEYYAKAGDTLAKDTDANGMRIKGFYELNCFGNVAKARECLEAAEAAVENFSTGSEREHERMLIARLRGAIEKFPG